MKSISLDSMPIRNEDILEKEVDDGIILYNPNEEKIFSLNNTAAYIWTLCDGKNTVSNIINSLKEDFNNINDGIIDIVKNSIKEMIDNHLIKLKEK